MLSQLFIVHQTELPLITVLHQEKDLILQLKSLNIELHTRKNIHLISTLQKVAAMIALDSKKTAKKVEIVIE